MSKGSLRWVRFFRELRCRYVGRIRAGLNTADFPVNTTAREARKVMYKNRKTSQETNPPPPNIISEAKKAPGRRVRMLVQMVAGVSVFIILTLNIKLNNRKSSL
jgi:hypothetical protein